MALSHVSVISPIYIFTARIHTKYPGTGLATRDNVAGILCFTIGIGPFSGLRRRAKIFLSFVAGAVNTFKNGLNPSGGKNQPEHREQNGYDLKLV